MQNAIPSALIAAMAAMFIAPVNAQVIWTSLPGGHARYVNAVAFSLDGKLVASASADGTVKLWEVATGTEVRSFDRHGDVGFPGWVEAVAFSPDSLHVASGGWDDDVRLWEIATGTEVRLFPAGVPIQDVAFSPDGKHLVAAGARGTLLMWDAESGEKVRQFIGHTEWVQSVAFSPDGTYLVSGGDDGTARLWDPGTGAQVRQFSNHTDKVLSVAFSPDSRQVASASEYPDDTIRLWEAATGTEVRTIPVLGNPSSMVFTPDGMYLAAGSNDFSVRLWELASGDEIASFVGDDLEINTVAISGDGKYLASAWDGYTVRLWDVAEMLNDPTGSAVAFDGSVEDQAFTQGVDIGLIVFPEAAGGTVPYMYMLAPSLPSGLTFDAAGRTISGIPAVSAPFTVYWYTVQDANESADSLFFGIEVFAGVSFVDGIADQLLPRAQPIAPLVLPEAAGGLSPIEYALTPELPEGLLFDAMSRTMTGTPTNVTGGAEPYTYKATGANGSADSLIFTIEVYSPVSAEHESLPRAFTLHGSYPNPFRDATRIVIDLPWPAHVATEVLDIAGRRVMNVPGIAMGAGWKQSIELPGAGIPSGLYLYRVRASSSAGNVVRTGRFMRIR